MVIFLSTVVLWVFSLCLHEYAHARVAYEGGDTSVVDKGYLSFNPLNYVHPGMSILIPLLILVVGGVPLPGGAVYIDHSLLRSPRWESAVSAAGPASNLLLAVLSGLPFALGLHTGANVQSTLWLVLALFCYIQTFAAVINLLPIPGLDGWGVLEPHLGWRVRERAREMATVSIILLLIVLIVDNPVGDAIFEAVRWLPAQLGVPGIMIGRGFQEFRGFLEL